jgi:hypothetical protein
MYQLDVQPYPGSGRLELERAFKAYKIKLLGGMRLPEGGVPSPWKFSVQPNMGQALEMMDYYPEFHLMSKRLLDALEGVGCSNLQKYPAEIINTDSGVLIEGYQVVNIVGNVSCPVQEGSESMDLAGGKDYLTLKLSAGEASALNIFRLAESRGVVIVSEQVAAVLQSAGLRGVSLEKVSVETST